MNWTISFKRLCSLSYRQCAEISPGKKRWGGGQILIFALVNISKQHCFKLLLFQFLGISFKCIYTSLTEPYDTGNKVKLRKIIARISFIKTVPLIKQILSYTLPDSEFLVIWELKELDKKLKWKFLNWLFSAKLIATVQQKFKINFSSWRLAFALSCDTN